MEAPPLEYATPGRRYASPHLKRRRNWFAPVIVADVFAFAFLVSQISFLLGMMIINIRESGVPPYWNGSSYNPDALGSEEFVRDFPGAAAWIVKLPQELFEGFGYPAFVANALLFTIPSYIVTVYLVWRCFRSSRVSRVIFILAAALMAFTLLWIWPAIVVMFD
jgi:hypothetical protein